MAARLLVAQLASGGRAYEKPEKAFEDSPL